MVASLRSSQPRLSFSSSRSYGGGAASRSSSTRSPRVRDEADDDEDVVLDRNLRTAPAGTRRRSAAPGLAVHGSGGRGRKASAAEELTMSVGEVSTDVKHVNSTLEYLDDKVDGMDRELKRQRELQERMMREAIRASTAAIVCQQNMASLRESAIIDFSKKKGQKRSGHDEKDDAALPGSGSIAEALLGSASASSSSSQDHDDDWRRRRLKRKRYQPPKGGRTSKRRKTESSWVKKRERESEHSDDNLHFSAVDTDSPSENDSDESHSVLQFRQSKARLPEKRHERKGKERSQASARVPPTKKKAKKEKKPDGRKQLRRKQQANNEDGDHAHDQSHDGDEAKAHGAVPVVACCCSGVVEKLSQTLSTMDERISTLGTRLEEFVGESVTVSTDMGQMCTQVRERVEGFEARLAVMEQLCGEIGRAQIDSSAAVADMKREIDTMTRKHATEGDVNRRGLADVTGRLVGVTARLTEVEKLSKGVRNNTGRSLKGELVMEEDSVVLIEDDMTRHDLQSPTEKRVAAVAEELTEASAALRQCQSMVASHQATLSQLTSDCALMNVRCCDLDVKIERVLEDQSVCREWADRVDGRLTDTDDLMSMLRSDVKILSERFRGVDRMLDGVRSMSVQMDSETRKQQTKLQGDLGTIATVVDDIREALSRFR